MAVVGILHPGQMGSSVAASATDSGNDVIWASASRSAETIERATNASLTDVGSLAAMATQADIVVSVAPPASATAVARAIAATGFAGIFLDANAISPSTAHDVASIVMAAGATALDGGIIGPPAWNEGTTRLYLAGPDAKTVTNTLSGGPLGIVALESPYGSASALKMAYAGWTKGSAALLLAMAAYAESAGVQDALIDEWNISQPGLAARAEGTAKGTGPKAWRFVGEMEEIAAALAEADLPPGFHTAAAEVYQRLAKFKNASPGPTLDEAIETLNSKLK